MNQDADPDTARRVEGQTAPSERPLEASKVDRSVPPWAALLVLGLVGGVVPLVLASHFGALGIPRNDDWSYVLSAFRFADTGKINGNGWVSMNLVGQLVLSLPVVWLFGHRIAALQMQTATFGVLGLMAVFDLARRVITPRRALYLALVVAVGPMWAALGASYMTDVPAFALAIICLALGSRAVRIDDINPGLFGAAVVVGFVAFTIREYAIVAPLALCLTALWSSSGWSRRRLTPIIVPLVSLIAFATIFYVWRKTLPGFSDFTPKIPGADSVLSVWYKGAESAELVALLVAPAVLLAGPIRLVRNAWTRAPRLSVILASGTVLITGRQVALHRTGVRFFGPGNYVQTNGILGGTTVSAGRPDLLPTFVLFALAAIGLISLALLVLAALPFTLDALGRLQQRQFEASGSPALMLITLSALGYALVTMLSVLAGLPEYDRYLLPLIPLVAILALRSGGAPTAPCRVAPVISLVGLLVFAGFGFTWTANSASYDGTRWRVAERASVISGDVEKVDGGIEWDSYHNRRRTLVSSRPCIFLKSEAGPLGWKGELFSEPVWGPTRPQAWIVAVQRRPC